MPLSILSSALPPLACAFKLCTKTNIRSRQVVYKLIWVKCSILSHSSLTFQYANPAKDHRIFSSRINLDESSSKDRFLKNAKTKKQIMFLKKSEKKNGLKIESPPWPIHHHPI